MIHWNRDIDSLIYLQAQMSSAFKLSQFYVLECLLMLVLRFVCMIVHLDVSDVFISQLFADSCHVKLCYCG